MCADNKAVAATSHYPSFLFSYLEIISEDLFNGCRTRGLLSKSEKAPLFFLPRLRNESKSPRQSSFYQSQ